MKTYTRSAEIRFGDRGEKTLWVCGSLVCITSDNSRIRERAREGYEVYFPVRGENENRLHSDPSE